MARRVKTLVNQVTVPGYGFIAVAGTTVIIADTDFQRIAPSFFGGTYPKLKDLGAVDVIPDQPGVYASQQDLVSLTAQLTALSSDVANQKAMTATATQKATTAQQTANTADANASTATSTAADASSTADTAHTTATTAQSQAATASSVAAQAQTLATTATQTAQSLTSRVTTLESKFQGLSDSLSALQGSMANKENTGVAAGLLANHVGAADPHTQYQTQGRADARYSQQGHQHAFADVNGLQTALDAKEALGAAASAIGVHTAATDPHPQYLDQTEGDARYSQPGHTHATGDVNGLQTLLSGKENTGVAASLVTSHTNAADPHNQYLNNGRGDARYAALSHVHTITAITGLQAALDGKETAGAAAASMSTHTGAANPHPQYCTVTSATALQTAITALQAKSVTVQQPAPLTVPAIALGGTTTLTVTWPSAMPNTDYGVIFVFDMGASLIGSLTAQLVTGSRTTTGCQVLVKSNVLLSLGAAKLVVVGISNG